MLDNIRSFFNKKNTSRVYNLSTIPSTADIKKVVVKQPLGSSGTKVFSGYFYEDVLHKYNGGQILDLYHEMRLSEPTARMCLQAVKNPIKSATWRIEPVDESDESLKQASLIEYILFEDMEQTWAEFLSEALTFIDFGFSVFEVVNKLIINNKEFKSYVGISGLEYRNQRTLERWLFNKENNLEYLEQRVYGDLEKNVKLPAESLLIFSLDKEGKNYQGTSLLRACIGPYERKKFYVKSMGHGIEKSAYSTPVAYFKTKEEEKFLREELEGIQHGFHYILAKEGSKIEFHNNNFDAEKVKNAIEHESAEIVNAFMANFLQLGKSGSGGSYALSFDQSDFFLGGIEHIAMQIVEVINKNLIPKIVKINFGEQRKYPRLTVSGIRDRAGEELAKVVEMLTRSNVIIPDDKLEDDLRSRYRLPKRSEEGQRNQQQVNDNLNDAKLGANKMQKENKDLKFAEKNEKQSTVIKLIDKSTEQIQTLMKAHLRKLSDLVIKDLIKEYLKLPDSSKVDALNRVESPSNLQFKKDIEESLSQICFQSIEQTKKEFTAIKAKKFTEWEDLPKQLRLFLKAKAKLLADYQSNELETAVYFQFETSITSTDSPAILENDLKETASKKIEGTLTSVSAVNVASAVVNEARNAFFFSKEIVTDIASFTFVNSDPKSPICKDLNGRTFLVNDPHSRRYFPPLHHLCKSYLVPNFKGDSDNPEVSSQGLRPSDFNLEKFITFSE
ncbi:MAG: DUF935 family protein [Oligoflexia bacterium]|nr:DUF935 family protein [Oligoflexia bacterium]